MLQSIEEVGMEKGMEKGMDIGVENTVMKLLRAQVLTKEQIADIIGLNMEKIELSRQRENPAGREPGDADIGARKGPRAGDGR